MSSSALAWQEIEKRGGALAACLIPLLDGLGWRGDRSRLIQSVGMGDSEMTVHDVIDTLRNVGFAARTSSARIDVIDERVLPVLALRKSGPVVLLRKSDNEVFLFDGAQLRFRAEKEIGEKTTIVQFQPVKQDGLSGRHEEWFWLMIGRLKPMLLVAALLTLLLNLLALVMPAFISSIYTQLMSGGSGDSIGMLAIGMVIFVTASGGFRLLRSLLLHTAGARVGCAIGREIFRRLLYFPLSATSSASVSSQVARVRDFDSIRDFIAGPPLTALFEMVFCVVVIIGIAVVAGPLAIIPLSAIVIYVIAAAFLMPQVRFRNKIVGEMTSRKQEMLIESLSRMAEIRSVGATGSWRKRYAKIAAEGSWAAYRASLLTAAIHAFSQLVMTLAGLATITWGVLMVIDKTINSGVLMSVLLLVWRVLMPVQSGFNVLAGIEKISGSIRQINRFMSLEFESRPDSRTVVQRPVAGDISVQQIAVRYIAEAQPVLLGVGFEARHGSITVINGHSGSGTSTVLSVIAGLVQPQAGRVLIDGRNVRQIDPIQHREQLSILPEHPHLFPGTISSNILMAHPGATAEELSGALASSGLTPILETLEGGLEHKIEPGRLLHNELLSRIALARLLLRPASIMLIDKPESSGNEDLLAGILQKIKGSKTIIIASGSEKLLALADQVIVMEQGKIISTSSGVKLDTKVPVALPAVG